MSRLPAISGRECVRALEKAGFYFKRQEGSHIVMRRDDPFSQVVVPDAGISGQMKCFMDRAGVVSAVNGNMPKFKVGAAVIAVRRAGAVSTFHSLNSFFTIGQMIVVGSSYWNMAFGANKGEVEKDAEGLSTMANLGRSMAWVMKSIKAAGITPADTATPREYENLLKNAQSTA